MDVRLVLEEPAQMEQAAPVYAYTGEDSLFHLNPAPYVDYHPTLGWMVKNKNETVASRLKVKGKM
ncbi:hypothetical protein [Salibacterium halotolerans]|uniref:hypothetical protein n=1 Tax=Salibacterium halotolerans TaxID=1884432 RepID=UPI000B80929F|nr:hypothetical protein [Salibacterium halotolerans]